MARTRSQSREPSIEPQLVHRQVRTVGEGTTRNARQAPQQLAPLSENSNEAEDDLGNDLGNDLENYLGDDDNVDLNQQSAASEDDDEVSDFNSGPIDDTFSQTELKQLDPEEMERNLEELNAQARRLLGCFKTRTGQSDELQSLIQESQDPESRQRQRIDICWGALEETQAMFTRGGEYLQLDTILRGLLRKRHTQPLPKASRPWRPDDVIHKANLAILVHTAMTQPTEEELVDVLMAPDQIFPSPFALGFTRSEAKLRVGHSALISETLEFALDLRTQVLVGMLNANADLTQDAAADMIRGAMLDFDENDDGYEDDMGAIANLHTAMSHNRHAKGWELLDPHAFETDDYAGMIIRRTQEITRLLWSDIENPFSDSSASLESGLIKLRQSFPRERFQKRLSEWSNLRLSEIDKSIKQLGGIDEIVTALEEEIRQRLDNPDAYVDEDGEDQEALPSIESNAQVTSNNALPAPAPSTKIRARPAILFKGRPSASNALAPVTTCEGRTATATQFSSDAQIIDDAASGAALRRDPPRLTGKLAIANARDEEERRKRRFIDPQPNGQRIVDDILDSQPVTENSFRLPRTQQQVSGRQDMEVDLALDNVESPSEDEGFQNDQRDLPNNRSRPRTSTAPIRAPASAESTQPERRRRTPEHDSPNKRQRSNPGQLVLPFQSTGLDYADSYRVAIVRSREVQSRVFKPQRGRKPWTPEEIDALIRSIKHNGISYAHIKRLDDESESRILKDRTPEDIRLKARAMKVRYLMSNGSLPKNLELVPLGKKEIEQLDNAGVHYEQEPQRSRAYLPTGSPEPSD